MELKIICTSSPGVFYNYQVYSPAHTPGFKKSQGKNSFRKQKRAEMRVRVTAQKIVSILTTGKLMNVFIML